MPVFFLWWAEGQTEAPNLLTLSILAICGGVLAAAVAIGGVIRWILDRKMRKQGRKEGRGILFCSGMIAGEGLVGILLAVLAVAGVSDKIVLPVNLGWIGGIALLAVIAAAPFWFGRGDGKECPIAKKD